MKIRGLGERMRTVARAGVGRVREWERGGRGGGGLGGWLGEGVPACAKSAPLPPPTIDTDAHFVISQIYGNNKNYPRFIPPCAKRKLFYPSRGQCPCLS